MRARIRTIKPEALKHDELWDLGQSTGLPIFQGFVGLWCMADRDGRFEWRPRILKVDILPYWDGDFSRVLDALTTRGFVWRYTVDGREYGVIPSFGQHQVINNREEPSKLPGPDEGSQIQLDSDACPTRAPRDDDACPTRLNLDKGEGNGRERKGTEGNVPRNDASGAPTPAHTKTETSNGDATAPTGEKPSRRKPKKPIPPDWQPLPRHIDSATERSIDCALAARKFRAHAESVDRRCADWNRAFDNWLDSERSEPRRPTGTPSFDPFERAKQLREAGR